MATDCVSPNLAVGLDRELDDHDPFDSRRHGLGRLGRRNSGNGTFAAASDANEVGAPGRITAPCASNVRGQITVTRVPPGSGAR